MCLLFTDILMRKYLFFSIVVITLVPCGKAISQENHQYMFISAQFHGQYIWRHYEDMVKDINNPAHSFEVNLGWKTAGAAPWNSLYNYPSYGFGFFYSNLNNPELFGVARSGFLFMEFPFGQKRFIDHRMKVSVGLAHLSTYYDPDDNPNNLNIGSPVNLHFNLNYSWFFPVSDRILLAPGLSFTHFSNGAFKKPNRGINLLDVNLAIRYQGDDRFLNVPAKDQIRPQWPGNQHRTYVHLSGGVMQRFIDDPDYKVFTLSVNHALQTGPGARWGVGLDFTYDDHSKERIDRKKENPAFVDYMRLGAFASHDIVFDRMSVVLNLGGYLYYGYEPDSRLYSRVGLRYEIGSRITTQLALKAYKLRANHLQWGLGYQL